MEKVIVDNEDVEIIKDIMNLNKKYYNNYFLSVKNNIYEKIFELKRILNYKYDYLGNFIDNIILYLINTKTRSFNLNNIKKILESFNICFDDNDDKNYKMLKVRIKKEDFSLIEEIIKLNNSYWRGRSKPSIYYLTNLVNVGKLNEKYRKNNGDRICVGSLISDICEFLIHHSQQSELSFINIKKHLKAFDVYFEE